METWGNLDRSLAPVSSWNEEASVRGARAGGSLWLELGAQMKVACRSPGVGWENQTPAMAPGHSAGGALGISEEGSQPRDGGGEAGEGRLPQNRV